MKKLIYILTLFTILYGVDFENIDYPLKQISIPKCDSNNKEVFFIKTLKDWKHINDKDKRVFCIKPGNYEQLGKILITSSGTKDKPRYILLDNKIELHPAQLEKIELAKYLLMFQNASYWIVDRQSFWESKNPFLRNKIKNSNNIIFNRLYFKDSSSVFAIYTNTNNITIQNSYFFKDKWSIENKNFYDSAAINLICRNDKESIKDIKIVNNEIVNYVDAIQAVRYSKAYNEGASINYEGLKIIHNLLYVTPLFYSDCKGNSNRDGNCSFSENGIDLKGGSLNKNNPIIIKNNILFGFKESDNSYSDLSDPGSAIVTHYNVNNVVIDNNWLLNSSYGLMSATSLKNGSPLSNSKIVNNIFYNIKGHAIAIYGNYPPKKDVIDGGRNILIKNNIFSKVKSPVLKIYNSQNIRIEKNIFKDVLAFWFGDDEEHKSKNIVIKNNSFYKISLELPKYIYLEGNRFYNSLKPIETNINFSTEKFTNKKKDIFLEGF